MIKPGLLSASVLGVTNDIFGALLDVSELRFLALQIGGTFSLTLIVEASNDQESPSVWTTIGVVPATGGSVVSSITAPGIYLAPLGYKYLRVRCSAFTSGPATVAAVFSRDAIGTLQTGSGSGGAGDASEATLAKIPGLSIPIHDYVSVAYLDGVTETYTFKTGGSGGSTVATVTVVYTDSTKDALLSVTKT